MTAAQIITQRIILIGFMGSGKTSLAKLLADARALKLVEIDQEILNLTKARTIRDIFEKNGEGYFREIENKVCRQLVGVKDVVISSGGGTVINPENVALLKDETTKFVYLKTSFECIALRLGELESRPLFQHHKNALELYNNRSPLYQSLADITIVTDNLTLDQVLHELLQQTK
jgi:shikimate kinase